MVRRAKVLVVDDEPYMTLLMRWQLEPEVEVLTATSYGEAVAVLDQTCRLEAIVSDHQLDDGHDGAVLLGRVALRQPTAGRVLVSAFEGPGVARALGRGVAHRFLRKPWTSEALAAAVRDAMGAAAARCHRGLTSVPA